MKFSQANAKIRALSQVAALQKYLAGRRKVYSFDLLSGTNCPYAKDCKSTAVVQPDGSRKIVDGKHTDFRCFSASQEVLFTNLYKLRESNSEIVKIAAGPNGTVKAKEALEKVMPSNAGIIRLHVGGEMATQAYFDVWLSLAISRPDVLFYAYTKSLPFWVKRLNQIPSNFILTASRGGHKDNLIEKHNLRSVTVVESEQQAQHLGLPIDHTDEFAANPEMKNVNFALLIHGIQPKDSKWGKAVKALKGNGSYSR